MAKRTFALRPMPTHEAPEASPVRAPAPSLTPTGFDVTGGDAGNMAMQRAAAASACEVDPSLTGADAFVPESIVNDLRRAIDQSDTSYAGVEPADTPFGPVKYKVHRNVNFDAVYKSLDGLSAAQIATVRCQYLAKEKRTLDHDLFDKGASGHPSSLTVNQRARLHVLLRGSTGATEGPEIPEWLRRFKPEIAARLQSTLAEANLPVDRLNALERDALEIVAILSGGLNDSKRERLMALHRRPVKEISIIDVLYERHTGVNLPTELGGKLDGLQHGRMLQLRSGNTALADAFALEYLRRAIERIDAERPHTGPYGFGEPEWITAERAKRRQAVVDRIDDVIALNRREAIEQRTGSASEAVAARLQQVLSQGKSDEGKNVGDLLIATLGARKGAELTAATGGALIEAHALRLAETESRKATKPAQLAATLRELRGLAEMDVIARAADPWVPAADKEKLLDDSERARAINDLAMEYVARFKERYEAVRGEGRPYDDLVRAFSGIDEDEVTRLAAGGGTLSDEQELDLAIRRNKPDLVIAILTRQPSKEAIDQLAVRYFILTGKSLQVSAFGTRFGRATTAEEAASPIRSSMVGGFEGGIASGRNAALVAEQLEKPAETDRGGVVEMEWIAASAEREFAVTWENRGITGRLREIGDDPETETIMRESIRQIRALRLRWYTSLDTGARRRVLAEMKRWRATLTGDAAAYEADNKKMLDTIRSAVSIAVQIALAIALPGAGATFMGFVRVTALNIASSVASNAVIYGEDYTLGRLRDDIVGGVLGAAGGKLGEELVGVGLAAKEARAAAGEIAERITKPVADATAGAAAKVGIRTTIAKEAASQIGSTAGQSVATGENQFTLENFFQEAWVGGAGMLGRKLLGRDAPKRVTPPRGGEAVPAAVKPEPPAVAPAVPVPATAIPTSKPTEVNKNIVRRSAALTTAAGEAAPPTSKPLPEGEVPVRPKAPGGDVAQEQTQVTGTPTGTVVQAADPHHLVDAWKLYQQHITADPSREVALLYNHDLDQWAIVQGGPGSVPTPAGMRELGWQVRDTTLARHSHSVGAGGVTSEPNLLPSGRGGDLPIARGDAPKGEPSAAAHITAIDVRTARGPDRTFLFYDRQRDMWVVDYPDASERGGRGRVSFVSLDQYQGWFQGRFGFSPDIPASAAGPSGPHTPSAGGDGPGAVPGAAKQTAGETAEVLRRIKELRERFGATAARPEELKKTLKQLERLAGRDPAAAMEALDAFAEQYQARSRPEEAGSILDAETRRVLQGTDPRLDLEGNVGMNVIAPGLRRPSRPRRAPGERRPLSEMAAWQLAQEQLKGPLEASFPADDWRYAVRFRHPDAPGETLLSTEPEAYSADLDMSFEVKRLDLAELGISPTGTSRATPSTASAEALSRARGQLAVRRVNLPAGTTQCIVFNITGQAPRVTDVIALGKQLRALLLERFTRYDRVFVQDGDALIEIPLDAAPSAPTTNMRR